MFYRHPRRGFTLVELLVVLFIVVVLAVIAVPLTTMLAERDAVIKGANTAQGMFVQSRTRAMSERLSSGVRLILRINQREIPPNIRSQLTDVDGDGEITFRDLNYQDPNTGNFINQGPGKIVPHPATKGYIDATDLFFPVNQGGWADGQDNDTNFFPDDLVFVDELEYVQDPGPFQDGFVSGPDLFNPLTGQLMLATNPADQPFFRKVIDGPPMVGNQTRFTFVNYVQPGDQIEFNGGGQLYQVVSVLPSGGPGPNPQSKVVLSRPIPFGYDIAPPPSGMPNYRILRRPRTLQGETPAKLPRSIVINMTGSLSAAAGLNQPIHNGGFYTFGLTQGVPAGLPDRDGSIAIDILFSPAGRVVGSAAAADTIYLWFTDTSQGNMENQALVVIHTRSGAVSVYGVQQLPAFPNGDPYQMAETGRGRGM